MSLTGITETAAALIVIGEWDAVDGARGVARSGQTLVYVSLTMLSGKTRWTGAGVPSQTVHTVAVVQTTRTEFLGTLINVYFTLQTCRTSVVRLIDSDSKVPRSIK